MFAVIMDMSYVFIIELLGTIAFTVSGTLSALEKRLDIFGVVVIAFATAIGGGTIRDILIGNLPVSWMRDVTMPSVILGAALLAILFRNIFNNLPKTLLFFDSLGLGLFAIIGIQKGLDAGIHPAICVALGTITGCFGGVTRDLLLREIPVLFHKEFYASACFVGGISYLLLLYIVSAPVAQTIAIVIVCVLRLLAVRFNWRLPPL